MMTTSSSHLKDLIDFPTDFTIKVMGNHSPEFEKEVLHIIHQHCPNLPENALEYKESSNKKYLSLNITIHAENHEQLEQIYDALKQSKQVLMCL